MEGVGAMQEQQAQRAAALAVLLGVLDQIAAEDRKAVFKFPVNVEAVKGYQEKISSPMCFEDMREKLQGNQYPTLRAFVADLDLIFENAK
jgi:hypothetical protein